MNKQQDTDAMKSTDLGRMDLNLLEIFDVVMTERHVTRSALRLGMTQSAISNAINRLRRRLNDQLFNKAARGIIPTPKAVQLWPRIHAAMTQLRESVQPLSFEPGHAKASFRIALADITAALIAPHLHREVFKLAPQINLQFVPYDEVENTPRLMRGELDFAFVIAPPRSAVVQTVPLWTDNFVAVARRDHPLIKSKLSLTEFCAAQHLVVNESGNQEVPSLIDQTLEQQGRVRQVSLCVNQFLVVPRMLRESDLIAVVPSKFAMSMHMRDNFSFAPLPFKVPDVVVSLSMHQRHHQSSAHMWMKNRLLAMAHTITTQTNNYL